MRGRRALVSVLAAVGALLVALGAAPAATAKGEDLTSSFTWSSSGPLIAPQPDATHPVVSVKDPSVVRYKGKWHVFATTADTSGGWSLVQTTFTDWSQAGAARQTPLDTTAIGKGYRAAPQAFYFAPKKKWYLVYQTGLPSYSTTTDIDDPTSWSAPKNFQDSMPQIIKDNIGNGYWVDFWTVCDEEKCYLFSSDDNGHLYRSETTVKEFPNGFGNTKIVLQDDRFDLFEASNVYKIKGTADQYLLLVEAIGSDGRRYFRSWTSHGLDGQWTPLADTEANPFARSTNVSFPGGAWTKDISHGEMVRDGIDQTMEIDPCRLRFLYQGLDPSASGDYSQLPYRLGLLTQTNSSC
ncbi:non-reducing end alpha-L-arabinofuranosidase family hydrolase [Streptomyces sp. NBC_01003]|uniref:non-reducing end alpha-L-arabinofuranosidase family hydrolase n=1 Tax=Streptomyces sp. NBC_01003 TaxID=2903714 RepID=UPI0038697173|nr:non-reducing end alpha-L-arabinofuranosidase family hydrolase [Streptomyces sp. NBC_01003]